eukprot:m.151051 g.151051  ORF g.151051 m.151051 type:complete len:357 (+) comp52812_c0_seq2:78-1148(+)
MIFLVALALVGCSVGVPRSYPLYKQCDPRWGSDLMGVAGPGERATICAEGCAMSSLSMALSGVNITLADGSSINPGTYNQFLVNNSLYVCGDEDCNLLWLNGEEVFTNVLLSVGDVVPPPIDTINAGLESAEYIYIAHVRDGTHFVLLTGMPEYGVFSVNDPYYNSTNYTYADISSILLYQVSSSPPQTETPREYPLFLQCDPAWGNNLMQTSTICEVGCLMSSVSMALNSYAIPVNGSPANPGTLNTWLQQNGGYEGDNDLDEAAVPMVSPSRITWPIDGMHRTNDLPMSTIRAYLLRERVVIANVDNGAHFVLVTGYSFADDDTLFINDPYFNVTSYSYSSDVVGWRIFDMLAN